MDFKALRRAIVNNFPQIVEVRELGAYKALLVFDSVKSADEAFTFRMNSFLQFFYRVWRWEKSERSETMRVWLEYHGVPLHVWSVEMFNTIGGLWGEVVKSDDVMKSALFFSVGRVLIDTCVFDEIKEMIHITVATSGFDVFVKEIGREIYGDECFLEDTSMKSICANASSQAGEMLLTA